MCPSHKTSWYFIKATFPPSATEGFVSKTVKASDIRQVQLDILTKLLNQTPGRRIKQTGHWHWIRTEPDCSPRWKRGCEEKTLKTTPNQGLQTNFFLEPVSKQRSCGLNHVYIITPTVHSVPITNTFKTGTFKRYKSQDCSFRVICENDIWGQQVPATWHFTERDKHNTVTSL